MAGEQSSRRMSMQLLEHLPRATPQLHLLLPPLRQLLPPRPLHCHLRRLPRLGCLLEETGLHLLPALEAEAEGEVAEVNIA